jgi:hypothetical protein
MRPVLMDAPSELDSIAMTISHRAAAIQALKALGRSELKRVTRPQFWNTHPSHRALPPYSIA